MDLLRALHTDSAKATLKRLETSKLTSIQYAAVSETCAKPCLAKTENQDSCARAKKLFDTAISSRKLEVLKWAQTSNHELNRLDSWSMSVAARNGHLHVIKYLQKLGIPWDEWTCADAAWNGHLVLLTSL